MTWKRNGHAPEADLPFVPAELPPLPGLDAEDRDARHYRRQANLWTLLLALAVVLLVLIVTALAALGVYSGLQDRALANYQLAQQHQSLGLGYLQAGNYELAVAEFEEASRLQPDLAGLQDQLRSARELAQTQGMPTSEVRRDAASALYQSATVHYQSGELELAIADLTELRSLAPDYQRQNVAAMLATAHHQLGLDAVREDRLDDAAVHFEAALDVAPDPALRDAAQEQLNLLALYRAALSNWERDWPVAIQSLNGLLALAPAYKDVRTRLHDAYALYAGDLASRGLWCQAAEQYSAAVQVFPFEETVDRRDDALIQCQETALNPPSTPIGREPPRETTPTPLPPATPTPPTTGRIIYPIFEAIRQTHDLYLLNLAQGQTMLLLQNASQPTFAPGHTEFAFRNLDPSSPGLGVYHLDDGQLSEITAHAEDTAPTWSPDTDEIAFASEKESDGISRIYVISPAEVRGEGLLWTLGSMPAWSPDGGELAYHGCDLRGQNCGLWTMAPGGYDQARLTTDPTDTAPAWSPDSSQVAFISARTGNWEIYAVDSLTGTERRLTNHPAADVAPVWSPDGRYLAFLSNRDGTWALYTLDVKSGQVQKLVAAGEPFPDPVSERLAWIP